MASHRSAQAVRREYLAKISLTGIFLAAFVLFIIFYPGLQSFELSPFDLVLLGLATFRLGRLVSYDLITEPIRQAFTRTVKDITGVGSTVRPRGEGVRRAIGQLISCPICAGTWIAAFLVYALALFPKPTYVFLGMMAAIGLAELMHALVEGLSWAGLLSRTLSGVKLRENASPERREELFTAESKSISTEDNQPS